MLHMLHTWLGSQSENDPLEDSRTLHPDWLSTYPAVDGRGVASVAPHAAALVHAVDDDLRGRGRGGTNVAHKVRGRGRGVVGRGRRMDEQSCKLPCTQLMMT